VTAYRNDIDALEARHAALEAEVADRTRARDEAARMLDEARGRAAVELREREAPLRRQRAIAIMIFLAVGSIMTYGVVKRLTRETASHKAIRVMQEYTDQMCACFDKKCADHVNEDFTWWATEMAKESRTDDLPSPEDTQKVEKIMTRYADCMTKLMNESYMGGAQNDGRF
jgi:hypothetical protein